MAFVLEADHVGRICGQGCQVDAGWTRHPVSGEWSPPARRSHLDVSMWRTLRGEGRNDAQTVATAPLGLASLGMQRFASHLRGMTQMP